MNYFQKERFGNCYIKNISAIWAILVTVVFSFPHPNWAYEASSPLSKTQQSSAKRGNSYASSGKADKAQTCYQTAIDEATSIEQCLALLKATEHFGSILLPVRRNCLTKALSLAKTDDDYFQVIVAARQCQVYEVTRQCIDALIARSKTEDALLALAHKSLSMAIEDVAHIAMEKLYMLIGNNPPDAAVSPQSPLQPYAKKLAFAEQAKLMAMEDLMRKAVKDILDQEQSAHGLCALVTAIEPLELPDLQRKILRKAVYQVGSVEDCKEVYEMGRRMGQQDIVDLAGFKGRKMILIEQANAEQQAIRDQQESLKEEQELRQAEQSGQSPPQTNSQQAANQQGKKSSSPSGPGF